jgi:hypothetical protein
MARELDGGVILVKPHGEKRGDAANMDVPRRHFYWSNPNDALGRASNWREARMGS